MKRVALMVLLGIPMGCGLGSDVSGPSAPPVSGTQTGTSGGRPLACLVVPCAIVAPDADRTDEVAATEACNTVPWSESDILNPRSGRWEGIIHAAGCDCDTNIVLTLTPEGPSSVQSPVSIDCAFENRANLRWELQTDSWALSGNAILYYQAAVTAELTIAFDDNDLQLARGLGKGGAGATDAETVANMPPIHVAEDGGSCTPPDCRRYGIRVRWNDQRAHIGFYLIDEPSWPLHTGELLKR